MTYTRKEPFKMEMKEGELRVWWRDKAEDWACGIYAAVGKLHTPDGTTCWPSEGETPDERLASSLKRAGFSAQRAGAIAKQALG